MNGISVSGLIAFAPDADLRLTPPASNAKDFPSDTTLSTPRGVSGTSIVARALEVGPGPQKFVMRVVGHNTLHGEAEIWTGRNSKGQLFTYLVTRTMAFPLGLMKPEDLIAAQLHQCRGERAPGFYTKAQALLANPALSGRDYAGGSVEIQADQPASQAELTKRLDNGNSVPTYNRRVHEVMEQAGLAPDLDGMTYRLPATRQGGQIAAEIFFYHPYGKAWVLGTDKDPAQLFLNAPKAFLDGFRGVRDSIKFLKFTLAAGLAVQTAGALLGGARVAFAKANGAIPFTRNGRVASPGMPGLGSVVSRLNTAVLRASLNRPYPATGQRSSANKFLNNPANSQSQSQPRPAQGRDVPKSTPSAGRGSNNARAGSGETPIQNLGNGQGMGPTAPQQGPPSPQAPPLVSPIQSRPEPRPSPPAEITNVTARPVATSPANLRETFQREIKKAGQANARGQNVSLVYPVRDSAVAGGIRLERIDNISPSAARTLVHHLMQQKRLALPSELVFNYNGIGGRTPQGQTITAEQDLQQREVNSFFANLTPDQLRIQAEKNTLVINGKRGVPLPLQQWREATAKYVHANKHGNTVSLVIQRLHTFVGPYGQTRTLPIVEAWAELTPEEVRVLLNTAGGFDHDGKRLRPSTLLNPDDINKGGDAIDATLAANGLSRRGLQQRGHGLDMAKMVKSLNTAKTQNNVVPKSKGNDDPAKVPVTAGGPKPTKAATADAGQVTPPIKPSLPSPVKLPQNTGGAGGVKGNITGPGNAPGPGSPESPESPAPKANTPGGGASQTNPTPNPSGTPSSSVPKGTQQSRKDALASQGNPLASGIDVYNPATTTRPAGTGINSSTTSFGIPTEGRLKIPLYPQGKADGRFKTALQQIQQAFPGIRLDFSRADLSSANLSGVDLSNAELRQTNFSGATMPNTNLTDANCTDANFSGAGLAASRFTRTNLTRANLSGATLYFADLETAILKDANLIGARIAPSETVAAPSAKTAQTPPYKLPASSASTLPAIRLMKTSAGSFQPVDSVPQLDPGQGYVLVVKSIPGEAPQIAFQPGFQATADGEPVLNAAQARQGPHYQLQQDAMPVSAPDPSAQNGWRVFTYRDDQGIERPIRNVMVGGFISFNADGTVTLTTKSGWLNKQGTRVGNLEFPRHTDPRVTRLTQLDGTAAREFARLVAQATGLTVRLGDPMFEGRDAAQTIVHPEQRTAQPTPSTVSAPVTTTPSVSPAQQPTPAEVRQGQTLRRRRDEDLTGQNITVRVNGNDLNPALLDVELAFAGGKSTGFTPRQIVKLAGGLSNSLMDIRVRDNRVHVSIFHPQLEAFSLLIVEPSKSRVSYESLKVNETSSKPLIGMALRIQQLKAAEQLGLASAQLAAGRSDYYPVGYFTWPKLGFDAEVPDEVKPELTDYLQSHPDTARTLGLDARKLASNIMLSAILFNPDGKPNAEMEAWWKQEGVSVGLAINLKSNSPSAIRFHQQLERFGMND